MTSLFYVIVWVYLRSVSGCNEAICGVTKDCVPHTMIQYRNKDYPPAQGVKSIVEQYGMRAAFHFSNIIFIVPVYPAVSSLQK